MANIALYIVFVVGAICVGIRRYEAKIWNKGVSKKTGTPWKLSKIDKDGGEHYETECGEHKHRFGWPRSH